MSSFRRTVIHYIARREEPEASANELFNVVASGKVRIKVNQSVKPFPACTVIAVAALPLGTCVEIDLVIKA